MVFWIIGPNARILLIDSDPDTLQGWKGRVDTVQADGITFLERHLDGGSDMMLPDWIVPAIPIHVAFEWIRSTLKINSDVTPISVPEKLTSFLPHPVWGKEGELYVSYAKFICPEDCLEPPDLCTVSGKPRETDLYQVLEKVEVADFMSVVIRSHQLAPGVPGECPQRDRPIRRQGSCEHGLLLPWCCACLAG
ncbi:MAG: hypothetical protein JRJ33_00175 [Deltaproteobacteria bacterium]|nr:hypothetical protein [Deltaproteobacteria bacterium]